MSTSPTAQTAKYPASAGLAFALFGVFPGFFVGGIAGETQMAISINFLIVLAIAFCWGILATAATFLTRLTLNQAMLLFSLSALAYAGLLALRLIAYNEANHVDAPLAQLVIILLNVVATVVGGIWGCFSGTERKAKNATPPK